MPIFNYNSKEIKLKDKVEIIKRVYELGKGGTNAAGAVESALGRNIKGDKKYRRIVFLITDGELLGGDAEKIITLSGKYPTVRVVPIGLGEGSRSVESLPDGRWLPGEGTFPGEMYKIMDLEFRMKANGRHGFTKIQPQWGQKLAAAQREDIKMQIMPVGPSGIQNFLSYDAERPAAAYSDKWSDHNMANMLFFDHLHSRLEEKGVYEIRYDISRLSESQIDIIKAYINSLEKKAGRNIKIKTASFYGDGKEPLISARFKSEKLSGHGEVDIKVEDGGPSDYILRITGMLNMALAAASLPENIENKELMKKYGHIAGFIKRQYAEILGKDFETVSLDDITLRNIVITLPESYKADHDTIRTRNELSLQALISA